MIKILKGLKILFGLPHDMWLMFITYLPGHSGTIFRQLYWKRKLKYMGKNVIINPGVFFQDPKFITLEDNSWIDYNVQILAGPPKEDRIIYTKTNPDYRLESGEVFIGKQTHIGRNSFLSGIGGLYIGNNSGTGANVCVYSFSHHYRNLKNKDDKHQYCFTSQTRIDQQAMILGPVFIDDFCGVGAHSVILPGTSLFKGTWVASGSVISGSYPEHSLITNDQGNQLRSLDNLVIKE